MLNETPALAPDGQPYRLVLTLRNNRDGHADGLGCDLLPPIPFSDGSSVREVAPARNAIRIRPHLNLNVMQLVANSRYTLTVKPYALSGVNQLHGDPEGFDKRRWQIVNQNDRQVANSEFR